MILKITQAQENPVPQHISKFNEEEADKRKIAELRHLLQMPDLEPNFAQEAKMMLKMLELKPLQAKIRNRVLKRYRDGNLPAEARFGEAEAAFKVLTLGDKMYESTLVDRHFYKRPRVYASQNKKEGKIIERFEQQMRNGQESRKKARHKEFLNTILTHAKNFTEFHKKKSNKLKKLVFETKAKLNRIEKKEQLAKDKEEKERLKALKEFDFVKYLDLIKKEKNTRLFHILEQTNQYLSRLGAKVKVQKDSNTAGRNLEEEKIDNEEEPAPVEEEEDEDEYNEDFSKDQIKEKLIKGSEVYYSVTHSIVEEIPEQPKMLTFGKLKSYQLTGLKWLVSLYNNRLNGILADEMGLGKTIQTIALFAYIMESKHNPGPFLVVVPLTTISNWDIEFDHWVPEMKKIIYKGSPSVRQELAQRLKNEKFNVVLTTYDYIMRDKGVLNKIFWQYIVVDEGHRMKNSRSKFALTLGQQYMSANRLLLTGTPLQNDLSELWALLNFILPKIFESCDEFKKWFDRPLSKMHNSGNSKVSVDEKKALDLTEEEQLLLINRLHQVLRPFLLRRIKKEVEKELPDKVEIVIKVELSAWQKTQYRQIQDYGVLGLEEKGKKMALQNTVMQLRKICNHPYQFFEYYNDPNHLGANLYKTSGKFELLDRIIPKLINSGHKILIFSQFTRLMDIMQDYFNYSGFRHLRLDGATKSDDRAEAMRKFNEPDTIFKIFLLSTRAGGHGLNLQTADTVIIFDSDWNPQMDLQAQDRAHRIGQRNEVRVFRLITNTKIEEDILKRASFKKNLDNKIIEAGMFNNKTSDSERQNKLEFLLKADAEESEDENEVPDDDQLNEMISRSDEEFIQFQQDDKERYEEEKKEACMQEIKEKFGEQQHKHVNYRLMQEWEVPDWVKHEPQTIKEEEHGLLGKRERKRINYADALTESQFTKIIDEGGDLHAEIEKAKEKKKDNDDSNDNENDNDVKSNQSKGKRYSSRSTRSNNKYSSDKGSEKKFKRVKTEENEEMPASNS